MQKYETQPEINEPKNTIVPGTLYITAIAVATHVIGVMYPIIGGHYRHCAQSVY